MKDIFAFLLWGRVCSEEVVTTSFGVFCPPGSQALEELSSSFFQRKDLTSASRVSLHLEFLKFLKA